MTMKTYRLITALLFTVLVFFNAWRADKNLRVAAELNKEANQLLKDQADFKKLQDNLMLMLQTNALSFTNTISTNGIIIQFGQEFDPNPAPPFKPPLSPQHRRRGETVF